MTAKQKIWPSKPGGGNLPQPYDPKSGEYVDMDKSEILECEWKRLLLLKSSHIINVGYEAHFPTLDLHDEEYNALFVEQYRYKFKGEEVPIDKAGYLLRWNKDHDKSEFLINKAGYKPNETLQLKKDLLNNAKFKKAVYDSIDEWGLRIFVPTILRNNIKVIGCWIFNKKDNNKLKFVTLDLDKEKYEELFETRG